MNTNQQKNKLEDNLAYINAKDNFYHAFITGEGISQARTIYLNTIWDYYRVPEQVRGK